MTWNNAAIITTSDLDGFNLKTTNVKLKWIVSGQKKAWVRKADGDEWKNNNKANKIMSYKIKSDYIVNINQNHKTVRLNIRLWAF